MEIYKVELSEPVEKGLKKLPDHVVLKLQGWVDDVSEMGLSHVRKIKGFHDEPLKGKRLGQRSIRLNKAYRAIYEIDKSQMIHFVEIVEVNKHDY